MTTETKAYSHNPTVSVLDAPVFPIYIPDELDELAELDRIEAGKPQPKSEVGIDAAKAFIEKYTELAAERKVPKYKEPEPEPAIGFLDEAAAAMRARAELRDTPQGERTAGKIARVFNAITGHELTEEDAWLFLLVLKIVRSRSGKYSRDDYVDMSAYSALLGEHASTIPR